MPQPERRDRQDRHAGLADEERVLVGPVQRAAVLEDAQPSGRGLLGHPVVEHDHAVRDVLLDAVAGEGAVAPLAGDHRGDPPLLEPAEQAAQLASAGSPCSRTRRTGSRSCRSRPAWRRPRRWPRRGAGTARRGPSPRSPRSRSPPSVDVVDHQLAVGLELGEVEAQRRDVGDRGRRPTPRTPRTRRARRTAVMPRTRNSIASSVLPQPAGPQTSVGRPRGRPPPVTSSRPLMPVGVFGSSASRTGGPSTPLSRSALVPVSTAIARRPLIGRRRADDRSAITVPVRPSHASQASPRFHGESRRALYHSTRSVTHIT